MPRRYRRKTYTKRRPKGSWAKRKQLYARRRGLQTYYFTRFTSFNDLISDPTLPQAGTYVFSLNNLPSSNEFTDLFDQYKICAVSLKFIPVQVQVVAPSTTAPNPVVCPSLYTCIDYDDANTVLSRQQIQERQTCKVSTGHSFRPHVRYVKPMVSAVIYESLGTSAYAPKRSWISTTDPLTPHYGIKYYLEPTIAGSVGAYRWKVEAKFYIKTRSVK